MIKNEQLSDVYQELDSDKLAESILSGIVDELRDRSTISRGLSSRTSLISHHSVASSDVEQHVKIITFPSNNKVNKNVKNTNIKVSVVENNESILFPVGKKINFKGLEADLSDKKFKPRPSMKQMHPMKVIPNRKYSITKEKPLQYKPKDLNPVTTQNSENKNLATNSTNKNKFPNEKDDTKHLIQPTEDLKSKNNLTGEIVTNENEPIRMEQPHVQEREVSTLVIHIYIYM